MVMSTQAALRDDSTSPVAAQDMEARAAKELSAAQSILKSADPGKAAFFEAFFRGASLRPLPPGASKHKDVRYLDIRENEPLDEAQMAKWIRQAAGLPGWLA